MPSVLTTCFVAVLYKLFIQASQSYIITTNRYVYNYIIHLTSSLSPSSATNTGKSSVQRTPLLAVA